MERSFCGPVGCEKCGGGRVERAAALLPVRDVLVLEVLHRRRDRTRCAVTECAEGTTEDVVAGVEQCRDVLRVALALLEPLEDLHHPVGAFAARRALAAGLVRVELGPPQHRAYDTGCVVED